MAYSAFNSQGPQVSVSLFGDAATRGVALGQNLPSVTSSIIQGVKGGLDYEQSYETKEINNRNNAAVADYNEVKAANAQEQIDLSLENQRLINEQNTLKLQLQQAGYETDLALQKLEGLNKITEANTKKAYAEQALKVTTAATSGNPEEQALSYIDPSNALFWGDKDNKEAQKKGIIANMDRYTPEQKELAKKLLYADVSEDIAKTMASAAAKGDNASNFEKDYYNAFSETGLSAFVDGGPQTPKAIDYTLRGIMVPSGSITPDGKGGYTVNKETVDLGGKDGTYSYVVGDKLIATGFSDAQNKAYNKYTGLFQAKGDTYRQLYEREAGARNIFAPKPAAVENPLKTPVIDQKRKELEERKNAVSQQTTAQAEKDYFAKKYRENRGKEINPLSFNTGFEDTSVVRDGGYIRNKPAQTTAEQQPGIKGREIKSQASGINGKAIKEGPSKTDPLYKPVNDMGAYKNQNPDETSTIDPINIKPLYSLSELPKEVRKVVSEAKKLQARVDKFPVVLRNEAKIKQIVPDLPGVRGLDLVKSVIAVESSGNINAKSPKDVVGIMQLTEAAAKDVGVTNRFDPDQNLLGGAAYLNMLLKRFDYNIEHALLAYNGGASVIAKAISEVGEDTTDILNYLKRVAKRNKNAYPNLDKIGEMEKYPRKVLTQLAALKYGSDEVDV